jgi:glycosyltransferase involved in cell wall biosynthesis
MTIAIGNAAVNLYATNRMNRATGYGRMELGLMQGLVDSGAAVRLVDPATPPKYEVTLVVGNPLWAKKVSGRRWVYTMSEATQVSPEWVAAINECVERVLVPCPPLVDIYHASGVDVPVHYVPLGVDWEAPKFVQRDPEPEVFTWLTYSLGDLRKGAELAMMAFKRMHGGDMRYRMLVKCRDNPLWLTGLRDSQIEIVRGEQSDAKWHALLSECHAFVFPSRGEGFGLPPREATINGMPSIATAWLGMWDIARWGWAVPVRELSPALFDSWEANAEGSLWSEPDTVAMEAHMRAIEADYPAALKRARDGREYLLSQFGWGSSANRIQQLLWEYR